MDTFQKHQLKIARDTLRMSDAGAAIMGGMTKDEARGFMAALGYSPRYIAELEGFEYDPNCALCESGEEPGHEH